jgi:NADPH:quinone reductase-like Zn-dependent oxidoreductase
MSTQQTVYRLTGPSPDLSGVRQFTEEIPVPSKWEVLLEIKALSLNYRDIVISNGTYPSQRARM